MKVKIRRLSFPHNRQPFFQPNIFTSLLSIPSCSHKLREAFSTALGRTCTFLGGRLLAVIVLEVYWSFPALSLRAVAVSTLAVFTQVEDFFPDCIDQGPLLTKHINRRGNKFYLRILSGLEKGKSLPFNTLVYGSMSMVQLNDMVVNAQQTTWSVIQATMRWQAPAWSQSYGCAVECLC